MSETKAIRLIFIISKKYEDESQTSEAMQDVFSTCQKNAMKPRWVQEQDCETINMKKTDFIVLEEFEGELFEKLQDTKSVILGPWCLLTCLSETKPIPNVDWPLMSLAMEGCTITCSNLSKEKKSEIRFRVQSMGGYFTNSLQSKSTHLVTDTVRSEKYHVAAPSGLTIVTPAWVDNIWEANLKELVFANNECFLKYKCKPFYNLTICSTGFTDKQEMIKLEKSVTENGGKFSKQLVLKSTDILVCKITYNNKYKAAQKHKIDCVTIDWIYDSMDVGYAIPDIGKYAALRTSTPTNSLIFDLNHSASAIGGNAEYSRSVLQETINTTKNLTSTNDQSSKKGSAKKRSKIEPGLVDGIDIKKVKMAGPFLDGCSVYMTGFTASERDKLCKIINFSGATRYDTLTERTTHIIVGDETCHELKIIRARNLPAALVTVNWVIDSMKKQQPVDEDNYLISAMESPTIQNNSPLSKKGLQLLRTDVSILETEPRPKSPIIRMEVDADDDVMKQYLQQNTNDEDTLAAALAENYFDTNPNMNPSATEDSVPSISISVDDSKRYPFANIKFSLVNVSQDQGERMQEIIEEMGGSVVSKTFKGIPNYTIVPIKSTKLPHTSGELVSDLWLMDCYEEKALISNIQYYHRPVNGKKLDVLKNKVLTISGYTVLEKQFLRNVGECLGAIIQDSLSRFMKQEKNVLATTHLISSENSGKKYDAAIKWNLPIVTKDWLLQCMQKEELVNEYDYLVGASKENYCKLQNLSNSATPSGKSTVTSVATSKFNSSRLNISIHKQISTPSSTQKTKSVSCTSVKQKKVEEIKALERGTSPSTPMKQRIVVNFEGCATPTNQTITNYCSQITPVSQIMQQALSNNLDVNVPVTPKPWNYVETPTSPLGAFICDPPPPELRKKFARWINGFPDYKEPRERRMSTPLSVLKKKMWNQICPEFPYEIKYNQPNFDESPKKPTTSTSTDACTSNSETSDIVNEKFKILEETVQASSSKHRRSSIKNLEPVPAAVFVEKDSQPLSVGWDDDMDNRLASVRSQEITTPTPIFMMSNISLDTRAEIEKILPTLGACVSNLSNFDPAATHLLCDKLKRNEKLLASMACGLWVLHSSYVEDSIKAGKLLNEEEYEFGNPKCKIPVDKDAVSRADSSHFWRKEIARRGYKAFHDMKAIVVASKRENLIRVIEAGGGMVVNASPPFDENLYVTHCLLEFQSVPNIKEYIPLAQKGIYCINSVYVSDFLHRTVKDISDYILPSLKFL